MIDERTEELASAYVIGALEPAEAHAFERQLDQDADLRGFVAGLREVAAMVGGNAPVQEPPAGLRARMLVAFEEAAPVPIGVGPTRPGWLPWALAAGLALVCVACLWQLRLLHVELRARDERIAQLAQTVESLGSEGTQLRQQVLSLQQSNRLAAMRIALLSARPRTDPRAVAVSVWDNDRQAGVLVVHHLHPAPAGKDYQLWIVDPGYGTPVDAGVLHVDANGEARADFTARRPIRQANEFAVTEEAQGGSPVPTLQAMVLAGT